MQILGSMGYHPHETQEALDLIASKKVNRDILITHRVPLEKVSEGFELQANPQDAFKVVILGS
jgi:threonine dehydrogenase-like Zn-dependent dehydrogenase